MMENLKQLFDDRDDIIEKYTDNILRALKPQLEMFSDFFQQHNIDPENITWGDVVLFDKLVVLIGYIHYNLGDQVVLPEGRVVEVTDDVVELLQSYFRIGIPLDIIERGSEEELKKYLEDEMKFYSTFGSGENELDDYITSFPDQMDQMKHPLTSDDSKTKPGVTSS